MAELDLFSMPVDASTHSLKRYHVGTDSEAIHQVVVLEPHAASPALLGVQFREDEQLYVYRPSKSVVELMRQAAEHCNVQSVGGAFQQSGLRDALFERVDMQRLTEVLGPAPDAGVRAAREALVAAAPGLFGHPGGSSVPRAAA